jgi:hypothetical protein
MMKDKRYSTVKNLINAGHVHRFGEIFEHIPKSVVYADLGMNNTRFNDLLDNVEKFNLKDLFRIARLFNITEKQILELVLEEYLSKPKKPIGS